MTRAIVHLDRLKRNMQTVRRHVGPARAICVGVKANGYGHGAVAIARVVVQHGATHLGVANVVEGNTLRAANIDRPILLYRLPGDDELESVVAAQLQPFVADERMARTLSDVTQKHNRLVDIHLKIDTGMGRIGCAPEDAPTLARRIVRLPGLRLAGTATHLADAGNKDYTNEQLRRFNNALTAIRSAGVDPGLVHAANSGAVLHHPDAWFDMVRPGIMIYGYSPETHMESSLSLEPVMEIDSHVAFVKTVVANTPISYGCTWRSVVDTNVATVNIGYGDGYNRLLSNRATALVFERCTGKKRVAPIIGTVCMDQLMLDVGPQSNVEVNDRVQLMGIDMRIPDAAGMARLCNTIAYEITCNISARVPRIYVDDPDATIVPD